MRSSESTSAANFNVGQSDRLPMMIPMSGRVEELEAGISAKIWKPPPEYGRVEYKDRDFSRKPSPPLCAVLFAWQIFGGAIRGSRAGKLVSAVRKKAGSGALAVRAADFADAESEAVHQRATIDALREEIVRLQSRFDEIWARLEEVLRTADQDMLLPVLNRRALIREISRFIDFAERYGTRSSLLFLDINGFKAINDHHGHPAG